MFGLWDAVNGWRATISVSDENECEELEELEEDGSEGDEEFKNGRLVVGGGGGGEFRGELDERRVRRSFSGGVGLISSPFSSSKEA